MIVFLAIFISRSYPHCSATIGFTLERTTLDRGEIVKMRVAARNDSKLPVRGMTCELIEEAEWTAKGKKSRSRKVLQSVSIPQYELDECLVNADLELYGRSRSPQRISTAAQQHISRVLQAGGGYLLRELTIPHDISYGLGGGSRRIKLGELKTYVEVRLVLNASPKPPQCRHEITVKRTPGVEAAGENTMPVAMAVEDGSVHATTARFVQAVVLVSGTDVSPRRNSST